MSETARPSGELSLAGDRNDVGGFNEAKEAEIARLVDRFYALGRADPLLGPVFESRVTDWGRHLAAMTDFWSSAVYRTGRYAGRPLEIHKRIPRLVQEHFTRWLELWEQAVRETAPAAGAVLVTLAHRMAANMGPKVIGVGVEDDGG